MNFPTAADWEAVAERVAADQAHLRRQLREPVPLGDPAAERFWFGATRVELRARQISECERLIAAGQQTLKAWSHLG